MYVVSITYDIINSSDIYYLIKTEIRDVATRAFDLHVTMSPASV
jgi:hypothetical protein